MQDIALVIEGIEQVSQLAQVFRLGGLNQVGLPGDHIIGIGPLGAQCLVRHRHRRLHQGIHLLTVGVHGVQQTIADTVQVTARIGVIDVIGRLAQLHLIVIPVGMNNAVLHLGAVNHQHHQHPLARQRQELHLPQR